MGNLIIMGTNAIKVVEFKNKIIKILGMTDFRLLSSYLGIEVL